MFFLKFTFALAPLQTGRFLSSYLCHFSTISYPLSTFLSPILILAIGQFTWNRAAVQKPGEVPIIKRKQVYVARNPKSTVRKTKFLDNVDAFTNQSPLWYPKVVLFIHSAETWDLCGCVLDWGGPENNLSGKLY